MPEGLQKKIGPLPIWAWALIMGGVIGGVILLRRGNDTTGTGDIVGSDSGSFLDPTQGFSEGSGSGLTGGGGAPSLADGITSTSQAIQAIKDAGLWPDVATQGAPAAPSLIALAPGARYYDPTTGETVDGPDSIAANSGTNPATGKSKGVSAKTSPLDRAMKSVQKGAVGPINRARLRKAGYTDAQIAYHVKHKTPLQQPAKVKDKNGKTVTTKKKTTTAKAKTSAAPTHPLQHVTAAQPNHGKPAYTSTRTRDSHGNVGTLHTYANGRKVFVRG